MPYGEKGHFLLNKQAGWRAASVDRIILDNDGETLRLRPLPGSGRPLTDTEGTFGGLALPTGLATDDQDRVYILDSQAHVVKRFDPCSQTFAVLPQIGGSGSRPRQLCNPQGLALSSRGDLYITDTGNRRVQIFSLKGLALRAIWGPFQVDRAGTETAVEPTAAVYIMPKPQFDCPPGTSPPAACDPVCTFPEQTWEPWDIVLTDSNWAYVSDYANGLIHRFDPFGHWHSAYSEESPGVPIQRPTHLALDKEERLYIVQEGKDHITVLDAEGQFRERVKAPEDVKQRFRPLSVAVDELGNLCLSERTTRSVYSYCQTDSGHYACAGAWPQFDGLGTALAFDRAGNPLLGDAERGQVVCMEPQAALEMEGLYCSEPLDSQIYRCRWHRIGLKAFVEQGTTIRVDTFTSEAPKTLAEIQSLPETRWDTGQMHTRRDDKDWDCLVQSPRGRYLWLRLTLVGNGVLTPTIRQVKVYYPRVSSLQYLPAVYQEDETSAHFLDQFLSIFDSIRDGISNQIGDLARYFDPIATPAAEVEGDGLDFLSWLASWLGLTLERHWPEEKRRQLLAKAHRLYALRGTAEGLRMHVELYTGLKPHILEHYRLRRWLYVDEVRLGDDSALWGKAVVNRLQLDEHSQIGAFQLIDSGDPLHDPIHHYAHQFTIFIPLADAMDETQTQTLERIVEMAKPAHTRGYIKLDRPRFRIGVQAFVGVDTAIGQYPHQWIEGEAELGYDTVVSAKLEENRAPSTQIGRQTRVGSRILVN